MLAALGKKQKADTAGASELDRPIRGGGGAGGGTVIEGQFEPLQQWMDYQKGVKLRHTVSPKVNIDIY